MVEARISKRKRNPADYTDDDFRVFDLTEDESEAMSEFEPSEERKGRSPKLVLTDDEDERKLRSFCPAKGSPIVKYARKARVHGQIPTITELADELKGISSQIVLPVHTIRPATLVNSLYLEFSADAVEVRGGDNEQYRVHEWPLATIDGIDVHYRSELEEDTRAFVTVRVSATLSSSPGSGKRIDEYVLELLKFRDSVADISQLSPVYGQIIKELKKEDLQNTARKIELPNSPTCASLSTSISEEEVVEGTDRTSDMPNSKACNFFFTSISEEKDMEKAVCTSGMPNSKVFIASTSKELDNAIAAFKGLVYPQSDPDAVTITQKDLKILKPFEFLNDTVIDFYIKYLQGTIVSSEKLRAFHFFNSFFFSKLAEAVAGGLAAFERVRKWTKKVNVFEKDFVFIPVNQSLHWSLIIICHPGHMWGVSGISGSCDGDPCILHLDSMEGCHRGVERHIKNYLLQEWLERNKDSADTAHAEQFFSGMPFRYSKVPQQDNSCDCGLFLLHYVELFLKSAPSIYRMKRQSSPPTQFLRRNWFKPSEASAKRLVILKLILELSRERGSEICAGSLETKENATHASLAADEEIIVSMTLADVTEKSSSSSKTALGRVRSDSPHLLEPQIENPSRSRLGNVELDGISSRAANSDRLEDHAEVSIEDSEFDDRCRDLGHIGSDQSKVSYEPCTDESSAHILAVDDDLKSGPVTVSPPDDETWNYEKCPVPRLPLQVKPLRVPSPPDDRSPPYRQPSPIVDLGTQISPEITDYPSYSLSNNARRASENLLDFDSILSPEEEDGIYESSCSGGKQRESRSNLQPVGHVRVSSIRSVQSLFSGFSKEDGRIDEGGRRPVRTTSKSSPFGRVQGALYCGLKKPTEDRVLAQKDSNQPYEFREEFHEVQDLSSDDSSDSSKKRLSQKKTPELIVKRSPTESGKMVTRSLTQSSGGLILSADKQTRRLALDTLVSQRRSRRR